MRLTPHFYPKSLDTCIWVISLICYSSYYIVKQGHTEAQHGQKGGLM